MRLGDFAEVVLDDLGVIAVGFAACGLQDFGLQMAGQLAPVAAGHSLQFGFQPVQVGRYVVRAGSLRSLGVAGRGVLRVLLIRVRLLSGLARLASKAARSRARQARGLRQRLRRLLQLFGGLGQRTLRLTL